MNAKRCDRCGEYYYEVEANPFENLVSAFNKIPEVFDVELRTKNEIARQLERHCDLCADCSKSFKEWLDNKNKGGTKNEHP